MTRSGPLRAISGRPSSATLGRADAVSVAVRVLDDPVGGRCGVAHEASAGPERGSYTVARPRRRPTRRCASAARARVPGAEVRPRRRPASAGNTGSPGRLSLCLVLARNGAASRGLSVADRAVVYPVKGRRWDCRDVRTRHCVDREGTFWVSLAGGLLVKWPFPELHPTLVPDTSA